MKIQTSKNLPAAAELIEILKQEFSDGYSYTLFGLGKHKTVLVGESTFIGAQISIGENEMTIQGAPPSLPAAYFVSFFAITEFAFFLFAWLGLSSGSKMRRLEKDLAVFLKNKFN
jgi:hypothetical protein